TPMVTPSPQPMVMTIHPAPSAFDHFNNTPPTTPTPNVIKTIVPRSSPINSVNITTSYILIDTINIIKTFFKRKKRSTFSQHTKRVYAARKCRSLNPLHFNNINLRFNLHQIESDVNFKHMSEM